MSLRYQVFHAIRAGHKTCTDIAEECEVSLKAATNIVSKLRCQGAIEGGPGAYRTVVSDIEDGDLRGKHGQQRVVAARNKVLMNGDGLCLLAECWPEPKPEVSDADRLPICDTAEG